MEALWAYENNPFIASGVITILEKMLLCLPHPQTNGICERFHCSLLKEFYSVALRKKINESPEQLQTNLDRWIDDYNHNRTRTGKYSYGRTSMQTFTESLSLAKDKMRSELPPAA